MTYLNYSNFGPEDINYWQKGFWIEHTFDLDKKCEDSRACKFLHAQESAEKKWENIKVKGYWNTK